MKLKYLIIISCCLLIVGITINTKLKYNQYVIDKEEKKDIFNFIDHQNSNYMAILEIPKISFKRGIKKDASVDEDITVLNLNNIPYGNIIIAGHSGRCEVCYFNDLDRLDVNDLIYFYYENNIYIYNIVSVEEKKKQTFELENYDDTITLITCKKSSNNLQIIITGKLIGKKYY